MSHSRLFFILDYGVCETCFFQFFKVILGLGGVSHVKKWSDKAKMKFCLTQKRLVDSRKTFLKQNRKL